MKKINVSTLYVDHVGREYFAIASLEIYDDNSYAITKYEYDNGNKWISLENIDWDDYAIKESFGVISEGGKIVEYIYKQSIVDIFEDMQEKGCPECTCHNLKLVTKDYVDFYGNPVVAQCDCGWEKEIVLEDE